MSIQTTRLESDEEVRQALMKYRPAKPPGVAVHREPAPADDGPPLFRPTQRPATPVLLVFDDGAEEGELIRIRRDSFSIGRAEGDLIIAQDAQMSGRHAQLRCTESHGKRRWHLADLNSTNGTYARISHALLEHGQEFIIGKTRFRFDHPNPEAASQPPATGENTTRAWATNSIKMPEPSIVEVGTGGDGRRLIVTEREIWIGKDVNYCQLVLANDPYASARHARIHLDKEGRWEIENNKSLNGVWLRIKRLAVNDSCRFMLGEQQFLVRIPT